MKRLTARCLFALPALASLVGVAAAESQADIANRENDEGKELMYSGKYTDASAKFRDAVARVPEPKYFFNLCTSMFQEGKFGEALTACNSSDKANTSDAALKDKIAKLTGKIKDEAKAQGLDVTLTGGGCDPGDPRGCQGGVEQGNQNPPNTGDPNTPPNTGNPNNPPPRATYRPVVGRAPTTNLFRAVKPDHNYTWTLGFDGFAGGASFQGGGGNAFGNVSSGFRIKGDLMVNRAARVGVEGYVSYTQVTSNGMDNAQIGDLDILDVGVAGYKHFCLRGVEALCLTPLVGASLAFMDPNQTFDDQGSQQFNYLSIGIRGELAAQYAFGRRQEHVLSVMFDVQYYTAALADPTDGSPTRMEVGLDAGGVVPYFGIGYTYRFNTPLGARAFVTLE